MLGSWAAWRVLCTVQMPHSPVVRVTELTGARFSSLNGYTCSPLVIFTAPTLVIKPSQAAVYVMAWHGMRWEYVPEVYDNANILNWKKTLHSMENHFTLKQQELSYRKQIARQLRTQFDEDISVTLKSTLMVTQGHWKRNHWTDHTRLTVRVVIGRWILSWPWNVGQRLLKVIESGTIWKFWYGFLTFSTLTLTLGLVVKVIENGAVR